MLFFTHYTYMRKFFPYIAFICIILVVVSLTTISFSRKFPLKYEKEILKYSREYDLDPSLVASIINTESSFKEDIVSKQGAIGLMQIMPQTAKYISNLMGENEFKTEMLFDPEKNINYGCYYLKYLFARFENEKVSLSAYNAGEGNVSKWLKDEKYSDDGITLKSMPYYETLNYVEKIENGVNYYKDRFKNISF